MAEGVLANLEKEFRPLLAPKLLAEAKAVQVVWARVKGYPAWPAQVLTEAAALRRKDLGQERHSKGNSVPVMFFGTVEVAWVKDADVVDFKEGLYQGFFDRKTKPFKLALEQVCEYLALDRKRKAPPKWWCKPPANGHDDQSDGPSSKPASVSGSGAAKGNGQRQDASKTSRQRVTVPDTDSATSSDEGEAPSARAGIKAAGKPEGTKDGSAGRSMKEAAIPAPSAKPRDSSTGHLPLDNGSTAASTNTAAQAPNKRPPPAPQTAPSRQQRAAKDMALACGTAKDAKETRHSAIAAPVGAKAPPPLQASQQQQRLKAASLASTKENDAGLPPRKRLKVEAPQGPVGPVAGSESSAPLPSLVAAKRTTSAGENAGELDAATVSEVDVLKLPAEIRRLAGIRVPALPKKPGHKVEESPVKVEQTAALTVADRPKGAVKPEGQTAEGPGMEIRASRPRRTSNTSNRAGHNDGGRSNGAGQGKRGRRAQSSSGEDSQTAASSDDDEEEDERQSSGEEADTEAAATSSSSSDEGSDASAEESDDYMDVAVARQSCKGAASEVTRGMGTRAKAAAQTQPARDRRGEKQRRLARLAAPEPANRRTSSRLVPKKPVESLVRKATSEGSSDDESDDASEDESDGSGDEDERGSSAASSSSDGEGEEEKAAREPDGSDDGGINCRSNAKAAQVTCAQPQRQLGTASRKAPTGAASHPPSHEDSERAEQLAKANLSRAGTDVEAPDEDKKPQRREGSGAAAGSAPKALPLELRRLQNSPSAAPLAVDTSEPRTLRDRPSPARRGMGSAGVTPTQTAMAGAKASGKRATKRASEDGSGESISPAADRARSPEHRLDGQNGSFAAGAGAAVRPTRSQTLDGRSSKASSFAGSASPAPPPVPGGVPVRKRPPSLGVPSTARSAGQAGARQLPAITLARAVLCSLASASDLQAPPPPSTLPAGGCAGTSAAGALLAPVAICVSKKPSNGPPTRRLVEPGLDAPVFSTDQPDAASLDCEADAKHASSPDVAAADAAAAGDGLLPRSPEPMSMEAGGLGSPEEQPPVEQLPKEAVEQQAALLLSPPQQPQDAPAGQVDDQCAADVPILYELASSACAARGPLQVPMSDAVKVHEQERQRGPEDATPSEGGVLEPQPAFEPGSAVVPSERQDQVEPQPSSSCRQGLHQAHSGPEPVEEAPALVTRSSVIHEEDQAPTNRSPARAQSAPAELQPTITEQEASAPGPQARSEPGSPIRDDILLAEEQLLDQGEAMAEHDGHATLMTAAGEVGNGGSSGGSSDPACTERAGVTASESPQAPTMPTSVHATTSPRPRPHHGHAPVCTSSAQPSALPPAAGSRASSEAGAGDAALAGASGASCSASLLCGEDCDAAARARARELEELGEVAAALAGLQRAEVPRPLLQRGALQPAPNQVPTALHADSLLDLGRSRGLQASSRSAGCWDNLPLQGAASAADDFRWPQPEPILPSQDQPFALPRDWLVTRPPRYEPIRRNLWTSRPKPKRLPKDGITICACRPPPFSPPGELQRMGCGPNCLNRLSSILCDAKLCPCGELCSNRSLHLLRQPKTEVFLTENRGWGVRAMEPLSKGAFIIEYAGEVIDERELRRRMDHARMNGEPHFYIMELSAGLYIDARRKGNIARLFNSSCEPNCETQKWHDASTGEVRVGIFAIRDIVPGEELVYDYFFSTYGAVKQSAASFKCMCGAEKCRGTMDLHPEKRRDLGRRVEVFWDADGQYYRAVVVAYHPTSKKHTIMYEDGGTEKLCLDEVPHRWMDDDQPRTSPQKPDVAGGDGAAAVAAEATCAGPSQLQPCLQQHGMRASEPEVPQQQREPVVAVAAAAGWDRMYGADADGSLSLSTVPAQPRPLVAIDQRCLLPPLGSSSMEAVPVQVLAQAGKHGLPNSELHLPLKKRQRMMNQQPSQPLQYHLSLPSPHSNPLTVPARPREACPNTMHKQLSGGSAGCVAAPSSGDNRHSGGGADSAGGDLNGHGGRTSLARHESSGTASGRVSSVVAEEDDPNEDLDSLLEAAEAVAALRTAPITSVTAFHQQDAVQPLQSRHVHMRSGSATAAGASAMAMVQTAKVASPRHLSSVQRAGPPNGLPPHGGGRPSGTATAHPSSSSSGFIPYQVGGSRQQPSGYGSAQPAQGPHDGGYGTPYDQHKPHHLNGKNGRFSEEHEGSAGAAAGARGRNGNGYGNGYVTQSSGEVNREDLLWKLVGIDKPKNLLPLFSGGAYKSRGGDSGNGRRAGSDSWIVPSHPYGKLLRALEASELLPHAEQLRLYAQQQSAQHALQPPQRQQPAPPESQAQLQPQAVRQQALVSAAAAPPTTAEAQALSAWQQLAQQQQQQHASTVASFLQQQHMAVAAAAVAASTGQLQSLQALHGHAAHAAAGAGTGASSVAAQQGGQQSLGATGASHWQQSVHSQPGSIIQDLVHMYVAQHAAGSQPMLAMAGTTTVGGARL